jgi:ech hydrogenase subunit D
MAERKDLIQDIIPIDAGDLLETAADAKSAGYRLGQACATKVDGGIEVLYTFEQDEVLKSYKISLPEDVPELQSVTHLFWSAFIYENEMHDLFGVKFKNLALDYDGHFFKIAEKTPWNPNLAPEPENPERLSGGRTGHDSSGVEGSVASIGLAPEPENPERLSGGRPDYDSTEVESSATGLGCSQRTPCEQTPPETDSVPRTPDSLNGEENDVAKEGGEM